jgi:sugar phosphate isomerase/epimerase
MRLAISNIAWDVQEDEAVARLLNQYGVDAIDIAPGKYFPEPALATEQEMARVRQWWKDRGIEITGMQALLFGTTGLNVFGSTEVQEKLLQHLTAVCRIGGGIGATRIVFGSPKNRDRSGLSDEQTLAIAIPFFRRLGEIAQAHGVVICLEPNPESYGANFMTNSADTAAVVRQIAHPAIRMQLDTGSLAMNGEDVFAVVQAHADIIGHIHASEPNLVPLGDGGVNHAFMSQCIRKSLAQHVVSIEMVATKSEPHCESIERALRFASLNYKDERVV